MNNLVINQKNVEKMSISGIYLDYSRYKDLTPDMLKSVEFKTKSKIFYIASCRIYNNTFAGSSNMTQQRILEIFTNSKATKVVIVCLPESTYANLETIKYQPTLSVYILEKRQYENRELNHSSRVLQDRINYSSAARIEPRKFKFNTFKFNRSDYIPLNDKEKERLFYGKCFKVV